MNYDVIVIGTGAGGGTLLHALAPSGLKILVLERGGPTDPPASAEYPYPPVSDEPRIAEFRADLQRLGLRPFPLPMGIMLDEASPRTSARFFSRNV